MSSFRPIAPAMDVYAASCNPSRRVKRIRPDDDDDDDDLSPLSSPSHPDDNDDPPPLQQPKRRGRRPGTLSRAAREAQRKINHSLIEKARRTKINDALATLRELVPPEYKRPPESHPDDSDDGDPDPKKQQRPKPKAPAEKEFKLEILVRTVAYLQDLTDRVRQLEHDGCPRCNEPISFTPSDHGKHRCDAIDASPSCDSRLPSISAWLPDDRRSILLTPSQSPIFDTATSTRATQLPTPPTSAICAPATAGFQMPPVLTLPSPSTLLPTTNHIQPRFSGFTSRAKHSPASSPIYTPDDETAASLLLRMSSRNASTRPVESDFKESKHPCALTPSRLLGLSADR